jgi:nucleotide-binding universal stress UspA family protein
VVEADANMEDRMFKRILLAVDGSAHAARATETAAEIAAAFDAELILVNVLALTLGLEEIERRVEAESFPQSVRDDMQHVRDALKGRPAAATTSYVHLPAPYSAIAALGEHIVADAERVARNRKVSKVTRVVVPGHPAQEILDQATKHNVDLIVMGTRGLTDIGALVLGSVSHKVIHLATCPCLTVK